MAAYALLTIALALLTLAVAQLFLLRGSLSRNNELLAIDRHRPDTTEEIERLSRATAENYQRILELGLAVDEGIRFVKRAEKRVAKTVQGARRLLAASGLEHPGLEAEAAELRDLDDEPLGSEEVPALPEGLEDAEQYEPEPIGTGIPGYDG